MPMLPLGVSWRQCCKEGEMVWQLWHTLLLWQLTAQDPAMQLGGYDCTAGLRLISALQGVVLDAAARRYTGLVMGLFYICYTAD